MVNCNAKEARVALAATIITNICKRVQKMSSTMLLRYPILLSQLMEKQGVDYSTTVAWVTTPHDIVNRSKLESFSYKWNGHWFLNALQMGKVGITINEPCSKYTGVDILVNGAPSEVPDDDQPEPRWKRPTLKVPLPPAVFQTQVIDWMEQSERNHNALVEQVGGLDAKLQALIEQQAQLLTCHGHPPQPLP